MESTEQGRRVPSLGRVLRHQLPIIIAAIVAVLGGGVYFVATMPHTYTATAAVLLSPSPGNPLTAAAASSSVVQMTIALETEAQMMRTPAVAEKVSDTLGRTTPDTGESLKVAVPSNTQMLEVNFTARSPERASVAAQAFAEEYLAFRAERADAVQSERISRLQTQIAETDEALRGAIGQSAAGASVYESQQVQLLADRLAQLNNTLSSERAVSTDPGTVVSAAALPERSNELPAAVLLVGAGVLGALLGLVLGGLREWRRDVLRDADDDLVVPLLAEISTEPDSGLVAATQTAAHEAYRRARTAVLAHASAPVVLAVAGTDARSASTVAVNLAIVLAEARFRVLLVATDPKDLTIAGLLEVDSAAGVAEVVDGAARLADVVVPTHGVVFLPAGASRDTADTTSSPAFRRLVGQAKAEFDYVVLAAASVDLADGEAVALCADATVLTIVPGRTRRLELDAIFDRLTVLGVTVIGAVSVGSEGRTHVASTV